MRVLWKDSRLDRLRRFVWVYGSQDFLYFLIAYNMKVATYAAELIETAKKIATPGKGILAADESINTIGNRFGKIKLHNTYENREANRAMLFTTPNLNRYISGVIQFEETLTNKLPSGESLQDYLARQGIIAGIKVDKGLAVLPTKEPYTTGLDGLDEKCATFYQSGVRFAKWRAVIKLTGASPSSLSISVNTDNLAKYAAICQRNGLVPIIEPEVLADGDHSIHKCFEISKQVYAETFASLHKHGVMLEAILLKANMITAGISCKDKASSEEIALRTVEVLASTVPPIVPGIVFLSGGQSEEEATMNLNKINLVDKYFKPWTLTFSYGRALQQSSLIAWDGKNVLEGQKQFIRRAAANAAASLGKYEEEKNQGESLHVDGYSY